MPLIYKINSKGALIISINHSPTYNPIDSCKFIPFLVIEYWAKNIFVLFYSCTSLLAELRIEADSDIDLKEAMDKMPLEIWDLFKDPTNYIGNAEEKSLDIVTLANKVLKQFSD